MLAGAQVYERAGVIESVHFYQMAFAFSEVYMVESL